jgi:hypothetical protein
MTKYETATGSWRHVADRYTILLKRNRHAAQVVPLPFLQKGVNLPDWPCSLLVVGVLQQVGHSPLRVPPLLLFLLSNMNYVRFKGVTNIQTYSTEMN